MPAHGLDEKRVAQLSGFVESAMRETSSPGVGLGIIQNGRVVFDGGLGALDRPAPTSKRIERA